MKKEKIKAKCHERAFCNSRGFSDDSSKESKEKTVSGQRPFFCFLLFFPFFSFSLTTQCKIISYGYRKECIKFLRHECESLHPQEMPERCPVLRSRERSRHLTRLRSCRCVNGRRSAHSVRFSRTLWEWRDLGGSGCSRRYAEKSDRRSSWG